MMRLIPPKALPRRRGQDAPRGTWSLLLAIPIDVAGLYLVLAALHLIPDAWPAAETPTWTLLATAVGLFALARAIALLALRSLLRWRAASDAWSKIASQRPHTH
jgi:hypothetical protein